MRRASNEALPTLHNLWRRKVVTSTYCPFCKSDGEDTVHALWSCRRLPMIWEDDRELRKCSGQKFLHFADLLAYFFMRKNSLDIDLLAVIMWLIWAEAMQHVWMNLSLNITKFGPKLKCICWTLKQHKKMIEEL